ncbi:MAG: hypothetical protein OCU12_07855 [Methanophagales archaeon]|nr:hypothetical protein [Methanophagales archaeon]
MGGGGAAFGLLLLPAFDSAGGGCAVAFMVSLRPLLYVVAHGQSSDKKDKNDKNRTAVLLPDFFNDS